MKSTFKLLTGAIMLSLTVQSCKKEEDPIPETEVKSEIPEFYAGNQKMDPDFVLIANNTSRIAEPQDLDFHPTRSNELWVINKGTENTGGSTVTLTNVGLAEQKFEYRQDGNAWHFMSLPSALSFSANGNWASSANVLDANHSGGTFTGPTLWSSDMNVYAQDHGPSANGSHLDMLHASPFTMGIESEKDNVFWTFDGFAGNIVRFDFVVDHGPGQHYHGDGKVHRYSEVQVKRDPEVPSHMVLDQDKKWLYIVDGGNRRILRMDITSGTKLGDLPLINEELTEYWQMAGVVWEEFIPSSFGLMRPSGIELSGNRLFVSDYETGEIICFNLETRLEMARIQTGARGVMGITLGKDGRIYYVNSKRHTVEVVSPK